MDKEDFETMILNHFIDRRIAFETYTLFHIKLETKMNEIMPYYNKIFDSFDSWNLFNDGTSSTKHSTDNRETSSNSETSASSTSTTSGISDRRYSKMPQNNLTEIQNGQYLTDYSYDTTSGTDTSSSSASNESSGTDDNVYHETMTTNVSNKIEVYERFIENRNKTMTMIFDDLESLFYGLVN